MIKQPTKLDDVLAKITHSHNLDTITPAEALIISPELREAKQAIYDLIEYVIGEDNDVPRPLDDESRARFYRKSGQNFLRNQQRKRAKELL